MPVSSVQHLSKRRRMVTSCSECYRRKQKCDRKNPCSNCVARNVTTQCVYDVSVPAAQANDPEQSVPTTQAGTNSTVSLGSNEEMNRGSADLGYSLVSGSNTFAGLQEILGDDEYLNITVSHNEGPHYTSSREDIQALTAKLPPRPVVNALVDFFFDEVNWHYFILERLYFDHLLSRWPLSRETKPLSYLKNADLSLEIRYFPALLFQVIALSLQFVPSGSDILVKSPAVDISTSQTYSDLGDKLLSLLGRPGLALTAVQADFLRSSWLKNCGRGVESWYTVGSAIRQAQELGLHRQKDINQEFQKDVGETLSLFWYEENKKRLWSNLFVWDSFMAMLLGRPRMINLDDCDVKPPMDCNIPKEPSTAIPMTVRPGDDNIITTVSAPLFRYALARKVHEMRAVKADHPRPKDYSVVRKLHEQIMVLLDELPAFLRLNNADTTYDLEYPYLPNLRQELKVMANLFLMTLHRPHVVSNIESRRAALQAALETLDSQHRFFEQAEPHQYHLFGLAFYTVDASFLVCIITILFPPHNRDTKQRIDHSVQRAINSLSDMSAFNPVAKSGLDVLQRCYRKLKGALDSPINVPESRTASSCTPRDGLHNLLSDLGQHTFDAIGDSPIDLPRHNATDHSFPPYRYSFDQTYWLDQLSMIQPSLFDEDPGNLWENVYFN